jgi:hypothetical protein
MRLGVTNQRILLVMSNLTVFFLHDTIAQSGASR